MIAAALFSLIVTAPNPAYDSRDVPAPAEEMRTWARALDASAEYYRRQGKDAGPAAAQRLERDAAACRAQAELLAVCDPTKGGAPAKPATPLLALLDKDLPRAMRARNRLMAAFARDFAGEVLTSEHARGRLKHRRQ